MKLRQLLQPQRHILGINARNCTYVYPHNPRAHFPLANDKITCKAHLQQAEVPTPITYGTVQHIGEIEACQSWFEQYDSLVIKPANGSGGNGILVLTRTEQGWKQGNQILHWHHLQKHMANILFGVYSFGSEDAVLIEEKITSHHTLKQLYPQGVADLRLIVFQDTLVMAMLRLPTERSKGKANIHQGGLGVAIDLKTGILGDTYDGKHYLDAHPDSGIPIRGTALPYWEIMVKMALTCAQCTPLKYLGIDIVIDEEKGPLVMELNARPGLENTKRQQNWTSTRNSNAMHLTKTFVPFLCVLILLISGLFFMDRHVEQLADRIVHVKINKELPQEAWSPYSETSPAQLDLEELPCLSSYLKHQEDKKWEEAEWDLRACLKDSTSLFHELGVLYFKAKRYNASKTYFKRYLSHNSQSPAVHNYLGIIFSRQGLLKEAENAYRLAISQDTLNPNPLLNLGILLNKKENWKPAAKVLERGTSLSSGKTKSKCLSYLGVALLNLGKKAQAKNALKEAINLQPDYLFPRINLALLHPEHQTQLQEINKVIALKPKYALAHLYKGLIYAESGDSKKAKRSLEHALQLNPKDRDLLVSLEKFYLDHAYYEQAEELLRALAQPEELNLEFWFNKAKLHAHRAQLDSAIHCYKIAINQAQQDFPEALLNQGLIYKKMGHLDSAMQCYNQAIFHKQKYLNGYYNRAILHKENGNKIKAIADYEQVILLDPTRYKAWYNLGLLYTSLGKYELGTNCFNSALEQEPNNHKALYNLGRSYSRWHKYEEAKTAYENLVTRFPKHARGWYNLGVVRTELEQYEAAKEAYHNCLELEPDNHNCWNNLGILASTQEQREEALSCFKQALDIRVDDHEVRYNLAHQHFKLRAYKKATPHLKKVIAIQPDYQKAHDELVACYDSLGWDVNYRSALKMRQAQFENNEDVYLIARSFHKSDKLQSAIKFYNRFIALEKQHAWSRYWLGKAWEDAKDKAKAIAAYNECLKQDAGHKFAHYRLYLLGKSSGDIDENIHRDYLLKHHPKFCTEKKI